jgi:hypothetical protein
MLYRTLMLLNAVTNLAECQPLHEKRKYSYHPSKLLAHYLGHLPPQRTFKFYCFANSTNLKREEIHFSSMIRQQLTDHVRVLATIRHQQHQEEHQESSITGRQTVGSVPYTSDSLFRLIPFVWKKKLFGNILTYRGSTSSWCIFSIKLVIISPKMMSDNVASWWSRGGSKLQDLWAILPSVRGLVLEWLPNWAVKAVCSG